MRIRISGGGISKSKADLAACFAYEGEKSPRGIDDPLWEKALAERMRAERFQGKRGDVLIWTPPGRTAAGRLLLIGLGTPRPLADAVRGGSERAAREAGRFSARSLALLLPPANGEDAAEEARAAVEGALSGAYAFDRHLTDPSRRRVKLDALELVTTGRATALRRAARLGEIGAKAVWLARDLVNEAPSRKAPAVLARAARKHAAGNNLTVKVLEPPELRRLGMSALLAVARGSAAPARVVHLSYRPKGRRAGVRVVLVGKGVTFDSGGLDIKPSDYMRYMKCDMAGAAAVLATMTALSELGCKVEVHALLGLVENMTGGDAFKPGDILDTLAGKTVEVGNTDAEGRLVLCDLLAYAAAKLKPTHVVDVATLTGACVVALGPLAFGLFTRHPELGQELGAAAGRGGEMLWPLPMYEEYLPLLQKGPADLCNIGGRYGGATTAALFLGEFLPRSLPWAHLDIAGPAFQESETLGVPAGATGAAVPTLTRWLESL